MERLTYRENDGTAQLIIGKEGNVWERLAAYEDTGLTPEEITAAANRRHDCKVECLLKKYNAATEELDAYKKAGLTPEELDDFARQASMIRNAVACRTFEECYKLVKEERLVVLPCKLGTLIWRTHRVFGEASISEETFKLADLPQYGKTVFLTREEAENALK